MLKQQHPLRFALPNELHARPYQALAAPERITHFAVVTGESEQAAEADREHVDALCRRYGAEVAAATAKHFFNDFSAFRLNWERHTEFAIYTVFAQGTAEDPMRSPAAGLLPDDWLDTIPGDLLVATNVALIRGDADDQTAADSDWFVRDSLCCSRVSDEAATVWTDFRIHGDGFSRFLIQDHGLTDRRAGRLAQRLLDIETYGTMALLALPEAQRVGPAVSDIDRKLAGLTESMKSVETAPAERKLLERLTGLAAEVEAPQAKTIYRFGAAPAYDALVRARIAELRESRVEGWQTIEKFMGRRFTPAMRTCGSVANRLDQLSRRITRVSTLLRTRVDIALEDQSQSLLASVDRSAGRQLRLQQTVEGLSVAAISYYVLGLISYGATGLEKVAPAVDPKTVTGIAIPFVVVAVWFGVRRLRRISANAD